MKKALLIASVGSTNDNAIHLSVEALERAFEKSFPEYDIFRAFTGEKIRLLLKNRGITVDSVEEALDKLAHDGYREVFVQPSHIFAGSEYEGLNLAAEAHRHLFDKLTVGYPLIHDECDAAKICGLFREKFRTDDNTALVMMGHFVVSEKDSPYKLLTNVSKNGDIYFVTNDKKELPEGLQSKKNGGKHDKAVVAPLMFTAGTHVLRDMAGEDGLRSRLESAGFSVTAVLHGLGEYDEIREMYIRHAKECMSRPASPLTREDCAALLRDMSERLHEHGLERFPKRSDFSDDEVRSIKAFFGPWPRALEAVGIKEPRSDDRLQKNREKRIRAKRRRRSGRQVPTNIVGVFEAE